MSVLPIRRLGDPILREPSRDVENFDDLLERLCGDMLETMYRAPGVGLAAPQVGLALRLFVFDPGDGSGAGIVANPALSEGEGEQVDEEGCLSIPGLYFSTPRWASVRVDGLDAKGDPVTLRGAGLLARIFQHEADHLNGTLFIDRLGEPERREAMAAMRTLDLGAQSGPATRNG